MTSCAVCGREWPDGTAELWRLLQAGEVVLFGSGKAGENVALIKEKGLPIDKVYCRGCLSKGGMRVVEKLAALPAGNYLLDGKRDKLFLVLKRRPWLRAS